MIRNLTANDIRFIHLKGFVDVLELSCFIAPRGRIRCCELDALFVLGKCVWWEDFVRIDIRFA